MNATRRSISSYFFYVVLLSFITIVTAQQDSILIISSPDSTLNNQKLISSNKIDSTDIIVSKEIKRNQAPIFVDTIPTILMNEDEITTIALSSFYSFISDADDSIGNLEWNFLSGKNTSLNLVNDQLTIYSQNNWYGFDTISVVISDSSLSDSSIIPLYIKAQNDSPEFLSRLDTIKINEDDPIVIGLDTLESIISDIDNSVHELSWSIIENYPFQAKIDDKQIVIEVEKNWFGNQTIQIIASDNIASDTLDVHVNIFPINDPPFFIDIIPLATIKEDESLQIAFIDWIEYVSDVDNSDQSLIWNAKESANIKLNVYENSMTLRSNTNWFGVDTIVIEISDGEYTDSIEWIINVNAVNDPPAFMKNIFIYNINEDEVLSIKKSELILEVNDPDNNSDELKLDINRSKKIILDENEYVFFIHGKKNWFGTDSLYISVSDGEKIDNTLLLIHIIPINDPPEFIGNIPDTSLYEDGSISFPIHQWYRYAFDPDNNIESLKWTISPTKHLEITIGDGITNIKPLNNWYGNETLNIIVSDLELSDTTKMIISVLPVNDFPTISLIPPIIINEDDKTTLKLDKYVNDQDDNDSLLTWSIIKNFKRNNYNSFGSNLYRSSRRYLSTFINQEYLSLKEYDIPNQSAIDWVKINSKYQQIDIQPPPNYFGKDIPILLQVKDPKNAKDIKLLSITIEPVNDAPLLGNIPIILMNEDEVFQDSINFLEQYVVDIDNPFHALQWKLISSNKWINYELNNNQISILPAPDWYGKDTVIITVSDGEYTDSTKAIINIESQNDPPEPFELIDNVIEDSTKFTFQWYPTIDVDNDTIEYHFYLKGNNIDTVIYNIIDKYSITLLTKNKLNTGTPYQWYVSATDRIDTVLCEERLTFYVKTIPQSFALHQNYPNPFNRNTKIPIDMVHGDALRIIIYDMHGKQIKTLSNEFKSAGKYEIEWDGTDRFGIQVSTGVYLAIMQTRNFSQARKLMFIK